MQEANLAYQYPMIYWNCANLISDSGGEDGNTNYGKIASAIGNIQKEGTVVALPDINRVHFGFRPDAKNNEIIYGLKPIQGINSKIAKAIIDNKPYASMADFYQKMQKYKDESKENKFGDKAMIQLIKAGCFDAVENKDRREIMADFIKSISNTVSSLKISNIEDLNELGFLSDEQKKYELRLCRFKKFVCQDKFFYKQTGKSPATTFYKLEKRYSEPFFLEHFENEMKPDKDYLLTEDGFFAVKRGSLDKTVEKKLEDFKEKVLNNPEILSAFNKKRFEDKWKENADGNISKWEMDSMAFYYHKHELADVNKELYDIKNFSDLPEEPEIADKYFWKGQEKPRFILHEICGTVLDRNKDKNFVTLLTPDGVVQVKLYKGQFQFYDKAISQANPDGSKTVLEKSWFTRGNKILVTGYRRGDQFAAKTYKDSVFKHSIQLITDIDQNGKLQLITERTNTDEE